MFAIAFQPLEGGGGRGSKMKPFTIIFASPARCVCVYSNPQNRDLLPPTNKIKGSFWAYKPFFKRILETFLVLHFLVKINFDPRSYLKR